MIYERNESGINVRSQRGGVKVPQTASKRRDSGETGVAREFYTVSQLADLLQLTQMTIYRMVNRAELPCYSIGRVKRFRHRDIEEFLDSCRVPAVRAKGSSSNTG